MQSIPEKEKYLTSMDQKDVQNFLPPQNQALHHKKSRLGKIVTQVEMSNPETRQ